MILVACAAACGGGNRLTYLDESDPYYVSRDFPKLTTPQWVGEKGVEAVVILSIDDMSNAEQYEAFCRPILDRLKQIDGRAPLSIMSNRPDPTRPRLQQWLKEGVSLETHTIDHPCPLLAGGDLAKAKSRYDECVDLLSSIPGNSPVAFRMPCCDSRNTLSPRFFAEIFNKKTPSGNFLSIDSSVFNMLTPDDPELSRELVIDPDGREKFRKYLPFPSFVNTIENYPYPYVIGRLCWEFPCVVPSDWAAQNLRKPYHPDTVADLKSALDAVVAKQGTYTLVFHPHGWIRSGQVVELIDHAVATHGKKVKFLTFREAQDRINRNMLDGHSLRNEAGDDNGVRVLDLNRDGNLDVVIGNEKVRMTRIWNAKDSSWIDCEFPAALTAESRFGIVEGAVSFFGNGVSRFDGKQWTTDASLTEGTTARRLRLRDFDSDGQSELIDENSRELFQRDNNNHRWDKLPFKLPVDAPLSEFRFVDIDEDGRDDVIVSNEHNFGIYLFTSMREGWSRKVAAGAHGDNGSLPMISRNGSNNGAWFHSRSMWVQNEDTATLPDLVDRRSFNDMLAGVEPQAKTPQASLRSIKPRAGFAVELVAFEPLVRDPIAMAWGGDGKFWVVEMGNYPSGGDGRVKFLQDTDGDGKYDKATLFLDGLNFPTGAMPWRKGVLITAAPEIFYAEDTDGDGRADVKTTLYDGFVEGNPQHRVNGLSWGLDNWLYGANGDSGGKIRSLKTSEVVDISGRDFRIRPDDGAIEAQSGQSQFGRSRDDWGNYFGCNNATPMYHFVLDDHYLRRNPSVAPPRTWVQVPQKPGAAPVFPISRALERFNDPGGINHFTSACSAMVYRDDLFGPALAGNSFVSEPVHNLIHREQISPAGVTFTSRRAVDEQDREFLASSDNWFRPTSIATGPDGALWIADMYRYVIEHPEWIPKAWQQRLNLRAGEDMGRIYRVFPVGVPRRAIPKLDAMDSAALVAALDNPSGWQRDTAQRLLIERQDPAAVDPLRELALHGTRPLARLHAMCALDGLQKLDATILTTALNDADAGIRRHAIRLCESRWQELPQLLAVATKLIGDVDPQVRMQLAYSLGASDRSGEALARLALENADDPYISVAAATSVSPKNLPDVVRAIAAAKNSPSKLRVDLLRMSVAFKQPDATAALLDALAIENPRAQDTLAGWLESLQQSDHSLAQVAEAGNEHLRQSIRNLGKIFAQAREIAADSSASQDRRIAAIRLLGHGPDLQAEDLELLSKMLVPQTPEPIQAAIVRNLGSMNDASIPRRLLAGWKGYAPALRTAALDVLARRDEWLDDVLDAIDKKIILPAEVTPACRQRLLQNGSPPLVERAKSLFASAVNPNRQKVVDALRPALAMTGDAAHGAVIFAKTCVACHHIAGVGNAVGPDLASLGDKTPESLLVAIVDPNRAVEARFTNYVAESKSKLFLTGILTGETANSVTLTGADGKPQTILRADLKQLRSTGTSLMPEGLETGLSAQDLADLIAHVRSSIPPAARKTFAGNDPRPVRPSVDGAIVLPASAAEIVGSTLVLEPQYGNLGYWCSEDDHAMWSIEQARAGKYEVAFEAACPDDGAGNSFVLEVGQSRLCGKIPSTGSWDNYKKLSVGQITLGASPQRLTLRSAGKISGAMVDLKSIQLKPVESPITTSPAGR
jgi:putative membrane-bound dehydrogenase-like protein